MLHQNILRFGGFRYLKLSILVIVVSVAAYIREAPGTVAGGGTLLGYILGTLGAVIIVWLMLYGLRRRDYRSRLGTVQGWLSAHVYLGLSLVVVSTLHTGFQFGWNVHTLAYALMLLVVVSGIWGVAVYFRNPALMSGFLEGQTLVQHGEVLRELDAKSERLAANLSPALQKLIAKSAKAGIVGSVFGRFRANVFGCPTRRAVRVLEPLANTQGLEVRNLYGLQFERLAQLDKIRGFVRLKTWTDIWLLFHVPLSFALLATLTAHIVAVFFYW